MKNKIAVLASIFIAPFSFAVSFDCEKANGFTEKAICSNSKVGRLDDILAENYKNMLTANIGDGAKKDLRTKQRAWITNRNKCQDISCIEKSYLTRIDEVCDYPVLSGVYPYCTSAEDAIQQLPRTSHQNSSNQVSRSNIESKTTIADKSEDKNTKPKSNDKFADLVAAPAIAISPTGELAKMFNLMSDFTDLQREDKFKEIKGKVIEWKLPVYEVERDGNDYKIQTGEDKYVGTFIYLSARNDDERRQISALKTGSMISIKGVIKSTFFRSLVIKPAILYR